MLDAHSLTWVDIASIVERLQLMSDAMKSAPCMVHSLSYAAISVKPNSEHRSNEDTHAPQ